jgi:hypothetical protein
MQEAAENPGRYGGKYVGRKYDKANRCDIWVILDDDPDNVPEPVDVLVHVTPKKCYGIGHARYWINEDGTVDREYLARK